MHIPGAYRVAFSLDLQGLMAYVPVRINRGHLKLLETMPFQGWTKAGS